jgi:hypothetical protein
VFEDGQIEASGAASGHAPERRAALTKYLHRQGALSLGPETALSPDAVVIAAVEALTPRDAIEEMLLIQMLAAHHAAMRAFQLAANAPNPSGHIAREALGHAGKLSRTFAMLLSALETRRGRECG